MLQRIGQPDQGRQRRAYIMRYSCQQGVSQALGLHLHHSLLCDLDVMHSLQCNRNLPGQCVELLHLLWNQQPAWLHGFDCQHSAHAHWRAQRHVVPGLRRKCCGSQARALRVSKSPVRHAGIKARLQIGWQRQLVMRVGCQDKGMPTEGAPNRSLAQFRHLRAQQSSRQVSRQFEQRLRAAFAAARNVGLKTQARGQLPDEQSHRKHYRKCQQVLHVANRKRKSRRHEEEVKCGHVEDCSHGRRSTPEFHRHEHHCEQK